MEEAVAVNVSPTYYFFVFFSCISVFYSSLLQFHSFYRVSKLSTKKKNMKIFYLKKNENWTQFLLIMYSYSILEFLWLLQRKCMYESTNELKLWSQMNRTNNGKEWILGSLFNDRTWISSSSSFFYKVRLTKTLVKAVQFLAFLDIHVSLTFFLSETNK